MDLAALREGIESVLAAEWTREKLIMHYDSDRLIDDALWRLAGEMGWAGIGVGEEHGGLGLGLDALAVLYEALGAACAPIPMLSTMLVADAIARTGTMSQKAEWLPGIAAGAVRAAISAPFGDPSLILDAPVADLILWRQADGAHHIIAPADIELVRTVDQTRSLGRVRAGATGRPFLAPADPAPIATHAALGIACDALGGGDAILALTIEYMRTREQFGRAIGSFQALKHRVADHRTALVALRAVVENEREDPTAAESAALKAWACEVYDAVAGDAVQLHGGIGFTWEYPCHPWLKRAKLNAFLFGNAAENLDRAAAAGLTS